MANEFTQPRQRDLESRRERWAEERREEALWREMKRQEVENDHDQ